MTQVHGLGTEPLELRLVEAMNEGALALNGEGTIIYCNRRFAEMAQLPGERIVGGRWSDFFTSETQKNLDGLLEQARHLGSKSELVIQAADGSTLPVDVSIGALKEDGIEGFSVLVTDISEHKRLEQELRWSEERFRRAFAGASVGLALTDLEGRLLEVNAAYSKITGYTREELLTTDFQSLTHPEDLPRTKKLLCDLLEGAIPNFVIQKRYVTKKGDVWVQNSISLLCDAHGNPVNILAITEDISERKRARLALHNQNERLRLLSEAASRLLSASDLREAIKDIYRQIAGYFRISGFIEFDTTSEQDELVLKTCVSFGEVEGKCEVSRLRFGEGIAGTVAQSHSRMIAQHVLDSDDPKFEILKKLGIRAYACFPLMVGDELSGTLSFATRERDEFEPEDVEFFETLSRYVSLAKERVRLGNELRSHAENLEKTVADRTAKLEDALHELQTLSYSIVHDMRSPLRAMGGFAQLLMEELAGTLNAEQIDYFDRIINAAHRLDVLIQDVLVYTEMARSAPEPEPIDLQILVESIVHEHSGISAEQIRIEGELPVVMGSTALLSQCFSNLLENAFKFMAPGVEPVVRIWGESCESYVRIWVEDNGIGIEPEYQAKIFRMFQRLHTNDAYPGTGIGLAIVQKVVERMGGEVGVESEVGKGSRFWVELPRAEVFESK